MNRLVMDYLVGKGYRDVAEAFWRESATKREATWKSCLLSDPAPRDSLELDLSPAHVDLQSVQERMSIQQLLLKGHVQKARAKLVQMDPQVWCNFNRFVCFLYSCG
jgi:hypothetical protein